MDMDRIKRICERGIEYNRWSVLSIQNRIKKN
jgi:hypothetical protein